jgi:hypothetical protein
MSIRPQCTYSVRCTVPPEVARAHSIVHRQPAEYTTEHASHVRAQCSRHPRCGTRRIDARCTRCQGRDSGAAMRRYWCVLDVVQMARILSVPTSLLGPAVSPAASPRSGNSRSKYPPRWSPTLSASTTPPPTGTSRKQAAPGTATPPATMTGDDHREYRLLNNGRSRSATPSADRLLDDGQSKGTEMIIGSLGDHLLLARS